MTRSRSVAPSSSSSRCSEMHGAPVQSRTSLGLALALALGWSAPAQAQQCRLDAVDTATLVPDKGGYIRFTATATEADGTPIKAAQIDGDTIKAYADDKIILPSAERPTLVQPFADTQDGAAFLVILAAHEDYLPVDPDGGAEGFDTIPKPFDWALDGLYQFVSSLRQQDSIAVYCYNRDGFSRIVTFGEGGKGKADMIRSAAISACRIIQPQGKAGDAPVAPSLYSGLRRELAGAVGTELAERKEKRRFVVLMSDGNDEVAKQPAGKVAIDGDIDRIRVRSKEIGAPIFTIAYDTIDERNYGFLSALATGTDGEQLAISPNSVRLDTDVVDAWRLLADRFLQQLVIEFHPDLGEFEVQQMASFSMEIQSKGAVIKCLPAIKRPVPDLPARWGRWLMIAGMIAGGLLLLFALYKLIALWIRKRNERPDKEVVYVPVESDPTGPMKGKLLITKGPLAGEVFPLTEEVSTIGRQEGNTIVIDDTTVSRRHAGIRVQDLRFELADLGSASGVFVNGRKISQCFLRDGDEIRIGDTELVFQLR